MKKIALIGDIVASRHIKNRAEVQKKISRLFLILNKNNKALLSPYTITIGDEFQALYSKADDVFSDICKIIDALYPETARFSIGIGELTTKINKTQALGMDGPAFHYAREGLDELKSTSILFNVKTEDKEDILYINQTLSHVSQNMIKWKQSRIKIFNLLREGKSIKEMSKKLKVTDKAIYKHIDAGALNIISNIFDGVTRELNKKLKV